MSVNPDPVPTVRRALAPFGKHRAERESARKAREEALRTLPRQKCFEMGILTVKDLDDEELVAGRCRDENGRVPKGNGKTEYIARELYDEMVAEHELRYKSKLRENLDRMLDVMVEIANDDTVEPRDRFEAAKYLFERTAGKTPETVQVNVKHAPWEELLSQVTGIAPMTRDEHRQIGVGIVDAELVDVDEEDMDDYNTYGDIPMRGDRSYDETNPATADPTTDPAEDVPPSAAEEPYQDEPERNYGRRADEKRSYQQQVHDAQALQKRRAEARKRIQNAKKQRKIGRALGADAIKTEITGLTMDEDGRVEFIEDR